MNTQSKWIDVQTDDGTFGAYLALPRQGEGSGPGIVLIQEIFGVNAHIRSVADQYAADGYVVLAPDLFWRSAPRVELGYDGDDFKRAIELMQACDADRAVQDIAATVKALRGLAKAGSPVAAIGYCMGGRLAYKTAATGAIDKAVAYYGGGIHADLDRADKINVPIQFHFGALDSHIPLSAVDSIKARFEGRKNAEFHVYEGADHGFNCSHRASYNRHSAALAHGHTLVFLESDPA
ncbi:dienelactone hydrolase family protein [Pararobbsia silviterrae]|uniref:Dienelactone hydrolase family protein n=1 Tax=Pararobbsia silviterrae TaxID=1792498 RepID=A0A494XS40_9BURK|nr:dienelactone hydrolase family protein [Pararobbsia silviterrae]RKP53450.1 dienelactone hydrolase family protein [Pararobbsia silviterrae]